MAHCSLSLDYNCAVLAEQIYSDVTPGPWFKRIQRNALTNSFVPKSSIFRRKRTLWIVFGGSSRIQDFITEANFTTCEPFDTLDCALRVHAGMWTNLKDLMQSRILPSLESNIARSKGTQNEVETIVISGHSLGGAYAILARFFLAFAPGVDRDAFSGANFHVVTFGAPFVFACKPGQQSQASSTMHVISSDIRNYINGCDLVPRLLGEKSSEWRPFVKSGFSGGKSVGAGLASAGAVLLNAGSGGMALSAAVFGTGFHAWYVSQQFGGAKQMAVAQLLTAPKLRQKWIGMLDSDDARSYIPVGRFCFLSEGELPQAFAETEHVQVARILDVPSGSGAFRKSIKNHQVAEYRHMLSLTLAYN